MVTYITVRLPPVDRPDAFTSGPRPGTPSPGPTTYPRVTGWSDTAASLEQFRRLSARYIASLCRRPHLVRVYVEPHLDPERTPPTSAEPRRPRVTLSRAARELPAR
jgi:hypothetical protein